MPTSTNLAKVLPAPREVGMMNGEWLDGIGGAKRPGLRMRCIDQVSLRYRLRMRDRR
jgi:hypothetical protein